MSTGADCKLYVDGVRFADGSAGEDPLAPVALSGLRVEWGRETTVDQPDPAACTFEALDPAGGPAFAGALAVGSLVQVTSTATVWPGPTESTFLDPGFEGPSVAVRAVNASAVSSPDRVHSGARALRVDPLDPARRWTVQLPPAPFVAQGTDPGAWDAIIPTAPGQTWSAGLWVYAPPYSAVEVRPILYTAPWAGSVMPTGLARPVVGAGWQFVSLDFAPAIAGAWVGLEVSGFPTGPSWAQVPGPWSSAGGTWRGRAATFLDDVQVKAPAAGDVRTVLVYSGRITDLEAQYDEDRGAPVVKVTAQDFLADLDNRDVGDEPWALEAMGDRFNRVLSLAGLPIAAEIDPTVYPVPVSWRDVDRQGATGLLQELAESVDGILWAAVHQVSGAYIRVEDPSARQALYALAEDEAGLVVIGDSAAFGLPLSSCDVLRDPVTFKRDVQSLSTRAAVTWKEQTVDDEGKPGTTEHTETVIDEDLEARHGTRRVSLSTELTAAEDAIDVAGRLLSRLSVEGWRAEGFVVDDDDLTDADTLLALLDGTSRIGLPVRITDLPDWAPTGGPDLGLYLEGGQLEYEAGRWIVSAKVSSGHGYGASVAWSELDPTWTWDQLDPAIRWLDLHGVAGPDTEEMSTL